MRIRRAFGMAAALVLGPGVAAAIIVACSGGSPSAQQPSNEDATKGAAPAEAANTAGETPKKAGGKEPQSVADCKAKLSEVTNEPGGGVATNNAMTSADAGSSDRFGALVDLVKQHRDAFRCCFDLYAKSHPGSKGHVVMVFELKPDGTLTKAEPDPQKTDLNAPDVTSCMVDVAKTMSYPKSPSGKETKFTYPFDFKSLK